MGALRNGPLFGNSLSAALEMRDAYRSFQLEAFCVASHGGRERERGLRANAPGTKKKSSFAVTNSYLWVNFK